MKKNGFTLIEVLVAIVLLAIISLLVWQASGATIQSKERFEKRDELFQSATLALGQMTRDLESAAIFSAIDFLGASESGEQRWKSVFIGKDEGDQDRVIFFAFSHVRYLKDVKESDQAEISYFLERDEETPELFSLKKRVSSPPDANPEEGGETYTLIRNVRELNFRYYDLKQAQFFDSWDSTSMDQRNILPRAVEILMVLQDPEAEEEEEGRLRFLTTAFLGLAPGPNDF